MISPYSFIIRLQVTDFPWGSITNQTISCLTQMDSVASLLPTYLVVSKLDRLETSVTRLGNLLDLRQVFKAFGNN